MVYRFKPMPGEKPDKNGYFFREMGDDLIIIKEGETLQEATRDRCPCCAGWGKHV